MKTSILLISFCLSITSVFAATIETIYLNEIKLTYDKSHDMIGPDTLSVYLDKHSQQPSYRHKFESDEKLQDAVLYGEKLIILRKIRNTSHLLILDKTSGKVIDNFWAIFASLSPTGRFIAFKKWQYRNEKTQYGVADAVTAVYDVSQSPVENRTLLEQKVLKHSPFGLTTASRKAGLPVYPFGDYNQPQYGWITNYRINSAVSGDYIWYQDNAFIFAASARKGMSRLVNVVHDGKQNKFDVKVYKLDTKDFMVEQPPEEQYLKIKHIEKHGEKLKLHSIRSIIRLDSLEQLEQIE